MAAEAANFFVGPHEASGSLEEGGGPQISGADCQIEAVDLPEVADAAFVEFAIFFEDVGLTGDSQTEGPSDWDGERFLPVGDGVNTLFTLSFDAVGILAFGEGQYRVVTKNGAFGDKLHGVSHRGFGMRLGLRRVASGAFTYDSGMHAGLSKGRQGRR